MAPQQLLLYMPVVHRGYEDLLRRHQQGTEVLLLGESFGSKYPVVRKDIRALRPGRAADYVRAMHRIPCSLVELADMPEAITAPVLIMPDEELMRKVAKDYRLKQRADLKYEPTFLRWDRRWSQAERPPGYAGRVTTEALAVGFGQKAAQLGLRTSDWWRQVGALAIRDGQLLGTAHNEHMPSPYSPYLNGDPRDEFSRGVRTDLTTALHAEASLIATAAREGTPLNGADLYVSTFPCPSCARLVAASGIARCFFAGGYSLLDGEDILRQAGVETIFVQAESSEPEQLSLADLEGGRLLSSPRGGSRRRT